MKSLAVVLLYAVCVGGGGCATSTAPENIGNPLLNGSLSFVQPGGYISSDDTVGTRAIVWITEESQQFLDPVSGAALPATTMREAYIHVHDMIPYPWPLADLIVNDSALNSLNDWRTSSNRGFQTHFEQGAASNTLRKAADSYIGAIDTTVTFGEHIRFTNLVAGETINTSSDRAFTYSGPSGNMEITLHADTPIGSDEPSMITKRFFGHKDGTVTLPLSQLRGFTNAEGHLAITRWDMRFLPTSNGTQIAYIARTSHQLPLRLVR